MLWRISTVVRSTGYTQSGNGHFMECIPSWWKNQPSLVRAGGECPPPFAISIIMYKVVAYAPSERAGTLPLFLLYPYMYSVVGRTIGEDTSWRIGCRISRLPDNGFRLLTSGFFMNQCPPPFSPSVALRHRKIVYIFYFFFKEIVEQLGGSVNRCQTLSTIYWSQSLLILRKIFNACYVLYRKRQ